MADPNSTSTHIARAAAGREIIDLIERAWPGVRVNQLAFQVDNREAGSNGEENAGVIGVNFSFSGTEDSLLRQGLLDYAELDSLPASGIRTQVRWHVKRGKRLTNVNCFIEDPHPYDVALKPNAQRVWDCLARVIAPAFWQPPLEKR